MIQNPHMLPKVRSDELMRLIREEFTICTLRISSFIPGRNCRGGICGCHLPTIGKGMGAKVTDLAVVAGCHACHDLLDGRDRAGADYLIANYPTAVATRMTDGLVETHSRLIEMGYVWGADWVII